MRGTLLRSVLAATLTAPLTLIVLVAGGGPVSATGFATATVFDTHQHAYTSFGRGRSIIRVVDTATGAISSIERQWGASGMVLSDDGSELFVALASGDAVSVIDTASATETRRIETGTASCPTAVTLTPGTLWFIDSCVDGSNGYGAGSRQLRQVDLLSDPPAVRPGGFALGATDSMRRLTPTLLGFWGFAGDYGYTFTVVDVTDPVNPVASVHDTGNANQVHDLAVSPDGTTLYVAGYSLDAWALPALTFTRRLSYSLGFTIATSADGSFVTNGNVVVGADGVRHGVASGFTNVEGVNFSDGQLVVLGDGGRIYRDANPGAYWSQITVTGPALRVDSAARFAGTISSPVPVPDGTTLRVQRVVDGVTSTVGTTTTANGAFGFTDTPRRRGDLSYVVTWTTGDAQHTASQGRLGTTVAGLVPRVTATTDRLAYPYHGGGTLTIRAPADLQEKWVMVDRIYPSGCKLNVYGACSITFSSLSYGMTLRIWTNPDQRYEAGSASVRLNVYTTVESTLLDAYQRVGTDGYYHAGASARLTSRTTNLSAGLTGTVETQIYRNGAWQPYSKQSRVAFSSASLTAGYPGPRTRGTLARMRVITASSVSFLATAGPWRVLRYTA